MPCVLIVAIELTQSRIPNFGIRLFLRVRSTVN